MNHFLYQLVDPNGTPFYVGATVNPECRYRLHLSRARRGICAVGQKIRDLGYQFIMKKLMENQSQEAALAWERHLIEMLPGLVNKKVGGGFASVGWSHTPEAREKIATANRGLKKDEETRAKMSARAKLRRWSPEQRTRFSETITCPHCEKSGGRNGMQRWHFDRCSVRR